MDKLLALFKSRKFWAAVIGVVLVTVRFLNPDFGLSDDDITKIVYLLVAYILGTGLEDSGSFARAMAKK